MANPKDFSKIAADNTAIDGVNVGEGTMQTADVNNALRGAMTALAAPSDFGDAAGAVLIDDIAESTLDAGVTIDGLQIKDGAIPSIPPAEPKVSITATDTTEDYLDGKIAVTGILTKEVTNPGGVEVLTLDVPEQPVIPTEALAKFWVNFNGAGTIQDSYNVASVVRNSTGNYTVTLTTPFATANWCANLGYNSSGSLEATTMRIIAQTANTIVVLCENNGGAGLDVDVGCVSGFGNQ